MVPDEVFMRKDFKIKHDKTSSGGRVCKTFFRWLSISLILLKIKIQTKTIRPTKIKQKVVKISFLDVFSLMIKSLISLSMMSAMRKFLLVSTRFIETNIAKLVASICCQAAVDLSDC